MTPVLDVSPDEKGLTDRAAALVEDALAGTTADLIFCLSGGSTPEPLYMRLAQMAQSGRLPIARIHWVLGDERFVPLDHPRSNYAMICRTLLDPAGVPAERRHPVRTDLATPQAAAADYEARLRKLYGGDAIDAGRPLFDMSIMGLGDDGHTASLFPGDPAVDERKRWALATRSPDAEPRVSLTIPVLESARRMAFLVAGGGKRDALGKFMAGDPRLPPTRLAPSGSVHVFADEAAASAG